MTATQVLEVAEGNKKDIHRGCSDAQLMKPHHQKRKGRSVPFFFFFFFLLIKLIRVWSLDTDDADRKWPPADNTLSGFITSLHSPPNTQEFNTPNKPNQRIWRINKTKRAAKIGPDPLFLRQLNVGTPGQDFRLSPGRWKNRKSRTGNAVQLAKE